MWGRLRGGMGNLFTQTLSSAAETGGVILGVNTLSPNPPAQDFKNANLMAPKIQQSRSFINGNFDGSTTMILVAIPGTFMMIGFVFMMNKFCGCVPSVSRKRKETQQIQITQMPQALGQYQDNMMINGPWTGMGKPLGFYGQRAVGYDMARAMEAGCGMDASLVRAMAREERRKEGKEKMEEEGWEVVVEKGKEKGEDFLQATTAPKQFPKLV